MEWTDPRYAELVAWYRQESRPDAVERQTDSDGEEEVRPVRAFLTGLPT